MTTLLTNPPPLAAPMTPQRPGQLPSLTGLRWAAAFIVFAYHIRNFQYFGSESAWVVEFAFGAGGTGVSFFFVLSGFVLAWSASPGDSALAFWRRRIARIYPVHLVTAALTAVLAFTLLPWLRPSGVPEAVANLLLVSSWKASWWQALNPVSWSLTCEAFFYAIFPALYPLLRKLGPRALTAVAGVSVATVWYVPWVNIHEEMGWTLHSFPPARLPEFVLGAALARLVILGRWRGPSLEASLAITLIFYFLTVRMGGGSYAGGTIIGFALLIPAAAVADLRGTPSLWRRPAMVRLGELSFAFYMAHLLVMHLAQRVVGPAPKFPVTLALSLSLSVFLISLGLSWALYEGVERPARRLIVRGRRRAAKTDRR